MLPNKRAIYCSYCAVIVIQGRPKLQRQRSQRFKRATPAACEQIIFFEQAKVSAVRGDRLYLLFYQHILALVDR